MNNILYLSFPGAVYEVLELMPDLQKIPGDAITSGEDAYGNLTVSIGVTGDLAGDILYTLPRETMLEMVRIMTGGMEVNEVDDLVTSTIDGISNIIGSKAMIASSGKNVTCDILPPKATKSKEGVCAYPVDPNTKIDTKIGSVGPEVRLQSK